MHMLIPVQLRTRLGAAHRKKTSLLVSFSAVNKYQAGDLTRAGIWLKKLKDFDV
jgi:hypothetical protein